MKHPQSQASRLVMAVLCRFLWDLRADQVLEQPDSALWPLARLMAGATVETTLAVAERLARSGLGRAERSDLTGLLTALAGLRLPRESVLQR